jgi:hypothetical protein
MRTSARLKVAAIASAAICAASGSAASANTYEVYGCRHPDGTAAPADGWSASIAGYTSTGLCSGGKPAFASIPQAPVPQGVYAELRWSLPASARVRLTSARIRRSVTLPTSTTSGWYLYRFVTGLDVGTSGSQREQCGLATSCFTLPESDVAASDLSGGQLQLLVECRDANCVVDSGVLSRATVNVTSSELTLEDARAPSVSNVTGSLAADGEHWGTAELDYRAVDAEAGVYRQQLLVDGTTVLDEVIDDNGARCRDATPHSGSPYEFDYAIPCRSSVDARLQFDVDRLTAGRHVIQAIVLDAAGNAELIHQGTIDVLSDPARRTFDAQGVAGLVNPFGDRPGLVLNGVGASRDAKLGAYAKAGSRGSSTAATATYPATPAFVVRVKAGSAPITGALVSVLERTLDSPTWTATQSVRTSRLGGATVRLAPGPSREVRFAYAADSESPSFVSSRTLLARIRPRVDFTASPRRLPNGRRVRFTGKVVGSPIPTSGLALALQATGVDRRWVTFKTIHATAAGRFAAAYRFRATTGTVRYRFRVRVLRQGGYPFAPGYSRPMSVLVKG